MDDLMVRVKFTGGDPFMRRTEVYRDIHHAQLTDGILELHSSEYGLVYAFAPESKWYEVEVVTPDRNIAGEL
jgi:hypothetical protein